MGPVCLRCGQMGALGCARLGIPRQVDQPCERPGCGGHYRLLTHVEEKELTAAWLLDGHFKNNRLYRYGRDHEAATKRTLAKIKEDRT